MKFSELDAFEKMKTKIKVIGVGGSGKNALNHMIENEIRGVEFYAVNTDAQDLKASRAENKLLIGRTTTRGQGAGGKPEIGRAAAIESEDDIHEMVGNAEMVVITCGMGGGTGTGAAPIIAKAAREHGCLTIGICTKPFLFEGPERIENAIKGLEEIKQYVDTLIVIPNERLRKTLPKNSEFLACLREADNVLRKAVQGISEIIVGRGLINIDFADIKKVMENKGVALLGIGVAKGENRAVEAARRAINSDLLEVTIDGATDAVINITASDTVTLEEQYAAIGEIRNCSGKNLNVIYGVAINNDLKDEFVVTAIATGYELKAHEYGYEDLADEIIRNMSDENIVFDMPVVEEEVQTEEDEKDLTEIFDPGMTAKEKKREQKLLKKKKLAEEKKAKKEAKIAEAQQNDQNDNKPKTSYPSWLKKNQ